jgi:hypothetical protein
VLPPLTNTNLNASVNNHSQGLHRLDKATFRTLSVSNEEQLFKVLNQGFQVGEMTN